MPGVRIYFIEMKVPNLPEEERPIKIGITSTAVNKRLSNLTTASPFPLVLLGCTPVCRKSKEGKLHSRFRHLRIKGEWFRGDPSLREFIEQVTLKPRKSKWTIVR